MVAVAYTGTPQLALLGFRGLGLRVWGLGPSNSLFLGAYSKPPPQKLDAWIPCTFKYSEGLRLSGFQLLASTIVRYIP